MRLDIAGDLVVLNSENGTSFLIASPERITLRLPQGDAERAYLELGGELTEADQTGTRTLELPTGILEIPDNDGRIYLTALRALHHAVGPQGWDGEAESLSANDLVRALRQQYRFRGGPDDMREYWNRCLEALWTLFELPDDGTGDVSTGQTRHLLDSTVSALGRDPSPYAGILELPPRLGRVLAPTKAGSTSLRLVAKNSGLKCSSTCSTYSVPACVTESCLRVDLPSTAWPASHRVTTWD